MGWNIDLVVIENADVDAVIAALALPPAEPGEETGQATTSTLGDATGGDVRDAYWGIGTLGPFVLATTLLAGEREKVWKTFSKKGRVLAFSLSENHASNTLQIYERGKRVVTREEHGARPWKPSHALEAGCKPQAHKADYIARVFQNLTGQELLTTSVLAVPMRMRPRAKAVAPRPAIDSAELEPRFAKLRETCMAPVPPLDEDWLAPLKWHSKWVAIHEQLQEGWTIDRKDVVTRWLPLALETLAPWPDDRRSLPHEHFETIARGNDDGRFADIAPIFRALDMDFRPGYGQKFRALPFKRFFAHPVASQLRHLDVGGTRMGIEMVELVAAAPALGRVRYLSFSGCDLGNQGVLALGRSTTLGDVCSLDLYSCGVDAEGMRALIETPLARQLRALRIGDDHPKVLGDETVLALAACSHLGELRYFSIRTRTLAPSSVRVMLESPHLRALKTLHVWDAPFGDEERATLERVRDDVQLFWAINEMPTT